MKALRVTALGLVVVFCLLVAAPAAHAADGARPGRAEMIGWPGDWAAEWMARLAGWLGWGAGEPQAVELPRPAVEAAKGDCTSGSGSSGGSCSPPPPTMFTDCSGGLDPNGNPCWS